MFPKVEAGRTIWGQRGLRTLLLGGGGCQGYSWGVHLLSESSGFVKTTIFVGEESQGEIVGEELTVWVQKKKSHGDS